MSVRLCVCVCVSISTACNQLLLQELIGYPTSVSSSMDDNSIRIKKDRLSLKKKKKQPITNQLLRMLLTADEVVQVNILFSHF